jgi:hypothetical protein
MTWRIDKIKKFMKEHEKVTRIAGIIASHFDLSADDDKVLEVADEIYRALFGGRVHIGP